MLSRNHYQVKASWQSVLHRAERLAQQSLQSVASDGIPNLSGDAESDACDRQPIARCVDNDPAAVLAASLRVGTVEIFAALDVQDGRESLISTWRHRGRVPGQGWAYSRLFAAARGRAILLGSRLGGALRERSMHIRSFLSEPARD